MRKIVVIQHVAYEPLGTLDRLLRNRGIRIRYLNFERDPEASIELEHYDGLIILGGPMHVDQSSDYPHLIYELKLIEQALKNKIPILGICLGAQLLAKCLGAQVYPMEEKEIGWHPVSLKKEAKKIELFKNFAQSQELFQWHNYQFDIPQAAIHLASSTICPNQAFCYQENAFGFQFHLEIDEQLIARWLKLPRYSHEISSEAEKKNIKTATTQNIENSKILSHQTFNHFIDLIAPAKKYISLPSR